MRKTILMIFFLFSLNLNPGIASAGESKSEEYGLMVTTSSRWVHKKSPGSYYFMVELVDSREQAYAYVTGVKRSALTEFSSQEAWFQNSVDANLKSYSGKYGYEERKKPVETKLLLGDGTAVFALEHEVTINKHNRSLVFAYWKKEVGSETIWYFVRLFNKNSHHELGGGSEVVKEIMAGIR